MPIRPHHSAKRIVSRNTTVILETKRFAAERFFILCNIRARRVACCDVEHAVRPKFHAAAVVINGARNSGDDYFVLMQLAAFISIANHTVLRLSLSTR